MTKKPKLVGSSPGAVNNVFEELAAHHVAVLATVGEDGLPHQTVVYYSINSDFTITFATKKETLKYLNIQGDNNVRMLVYDEKTLLTIQVYGKANESTDEKQKTKAIEDMYWAADQNDHELPPLTKLYAGELVVFEVSPVHMHMAYFIRPQAGGYDTFETLDFGEGIDKKRVKISGLKPSLDKDRTVIEQTDIG